MLYLIKIEFLTLYKKKITDNKYYLLNNRPVPIRFRVFVSTLRLVSTQSVCETPRDTRIKFCTVGVIFFLRERKVFALKLALGLKTLGKLSSMTNPYRDNVIPDLRQQLATARTPRARAVPAGAIRLHRYTLLFNTLLLIRSTWTCIMVQG